jgi:trafficking protein particle complex subunit 11
LSSTTVDTSVVFWTNEAVVKERVAFQLSITAPSNIAISALPFSSLAIYFSHKEEPVIVYHNLDLAANTKVQRVDLGDLPPEIAVECQGHLQWEKSATIVFAGTVSSDVPITLTVCSHSPETPRL